MSSNNAYRIQGMQHVGIAITDMDTTLKLYRSLFGMDIPFFDSVQAAPLMDTHPRGETITQRVEDTYTHKKQTGGSGQFAKIDYVIEPGEVGSGYEFESTVTGGNVPREFWPAVEKAFGVSMEEGTLAGFPLLDVKVTLTDGGFHAVDSSAIAYELAAKAAYRQSVPKAKPQLLEPVMKVDVFTPDDHVGDVIGDLNRRRGMIKSQEAGLTGVRVKADVALAEMFGYIGDLRTMTSGRGQFSMEFSHYAPCPPNVADQVIQEVKERKEAS